MGCEIVIDVTIHRVLRRILCQRLGRHILRRHRMSRQIQVRSVIDEVLDAKKDLLILFQMQSRQIKEGHDIQFIIFQPLNHLPDFQVVDPERGSAVVLLEISEMAVHVDIA